MVFLRFNVWFFLLHNYVTYKYIHHGYYDCPQKRVILCRFTTCEISEISLHYIISAVESVVKYYTSR